MVDALERPMPTTQGQGSRRARQMSSKPLVWRGTDCNSVLWILLLSIEGATRQRSRHWTGVLRGLRVPSGAPPGDI
jgi:hypothetical protein